MSFAASNWLSAAALSRFASARYARPAATFARSNAVIEDVRGRRSAAMKALMYVWIAAVSPSTAHQPYNFVNVVRGASANTRLSSARVESAGTIPARAMLYIIVGRSECTGSDDVRRNASRRCPRNWSASTICVATHVAFSVPESVSVGRLASARPILTATAAVSATWRRSRDA